MAYTAPATWTAGQLVNATDLNTQIRDNLLALAGTDGKVAQIQSFITTAAGGTTTTSTSGVALASFVTPAMTTLAGSLVLVFGWFGATGSVTGSALTMFLEQDAAGFSGLAQANIPTATYAVNLSAASVYSPAAGSHTWTLGWSISSGTATANTAPNSGIIAIEFRTH